MGLLQEGKWVDKWYDTKSTGGKFVRKESAFRDWITADGRSGFKAEKDRYHVYISYACPWASRVLVFLQLKQLQDVISYSTVDPVMLENGWEFNQTYPDPLYQKNFAYQLYVKADAEYSGRVTVPILWDKHKETIVSNESSEIIRMLNSEFQALTQVEHDYYPEALRQEIDSVNDVIYSDVNNGVYKCGFATTQQAYDEAVERLFSRLEKLEKHFATHQYLVAEQQTEADWRLFTTLIRFDAAYHYHFKCNVKKLSDYPHLSAYLGRLYHEPGIAETVKFDHIKTHYYVSHRTINPTGVIPKGPMLSF